MIGDNQDHGDMYCPHLNFKAAFSMKDPKTPKEKKEKQENHESGDAEVLSKISHCEYCSEDPPASTPHLWRCLDSKCGLLLCGSQSMNHANRHFEDFPSHKTQENINTKRIWCNECKHEVLPLTKNRRRSPAIWGPSPEAEEDPPKGLYNIGNTCFMNSALQCMVSVMPLNSYLIGQCTSLSGKNVSSSYQSLLGELWSSDDPLSYKGVIPSRLLHAVRTSHPIFRGFQQHDTQEFLRLFMDSLAEETRIPHFTLEKEEDKQKEKPDEASDSETESFETCDSGNASEETLSMEIGEEERRSLKEVKITFRSIVSDIFDGRVESSVQCLSCKQTSSRLEVFQDLSLPIPTREELANIQHQRQWNEEGRPAGWITWFWDWMKSFMWGPTPTLDDCFASFFSSDELKGKNMYSCDKCGKLRNGVKRCSLHRLPEVLSIHLKRFRVYEFSGGIGFSSKLNQYIKFPLENLNLKPFLHKDCDDEGPTYRLQGAICHFGSFLGGHYTAFIRKGENWFLCDDSRVTQVSPETVAESEAYVLFYQKWNGEESDMIRDQVMEMWRNWERREAEGPLHLISRKWLTQLFWSEEPGPLDNSDVVCPHGRIVPYEFAHMGAAWVPASVWKILITKFGGGPDLQESVECVICSAAWRKLQKSNQREKDKAGALALRKGLTQFLFNSPSLSPKPSVEQRLEVETEEESE